MSLPLLLSTLCVVPIPAPAADSLQEIWERGVPFAEFLAAAKARRETWRDNYAFGRLEEETAGRARSLAGTWRLLVVAEDACGDSANTIPYVATLVDSAAGRIEMRVISSKVGRGIMEAHRTADGRAATPTIILLDEAWREVGCWVERPTPLARQVAEETKRLGEREAVERKYAWYREDRGRTTLREVLAMIETAAPGQPCGGNTENGGT
ncbi:MAG TPA: thioredoxin family protein [Gemmatimonadales bacterium]